MEIRLRITAHETDYRVNELILCIPMFLAICDSLLSPLYALFMIIISHLNPTQLRRYEMHNHLASMSPTPLYSSPVSLILLSSSPSR